MASLNKVFLLGNLTRNPELRYTAGGAAVCNLGLAVNRRYTTSQGEDREEVCFVEIEVWGKQAESCQQYLTKGSPALIEGRLRYDAWDDRETGRRRSRLVVRADRVQFVGPPSRNSQAFGEAPEAAGAPPPPQYSPTRPPAPRPAAAPRSAAPAPPQQPAAPPPAPPEIDEVDDDIPF